jgi:hypothetical protein
MDAELPRCAVCRVTIEPGQNAAFRPDGRVHHEICPGVTCLVCGRAIAPHEPIRRDKDGLVHSSCWMRRRRAATAALVSSMSATDRVLAVIRTKLSTGALPRLMAEKLWAGRSAGRTCDACDQRIKTSETELAVDLPGGPTLALHRECFGIWQSEVARQHPTLDSRTG